jgi:hypothetical protein
MQESSESPRARLLRRLGLPEGAQTDELAGKRDWRRDLQRLDELLVLDASRGAPLTETIGFVVVLGREQLDSADHEIVDGYVTARRQGCQRVMGAASGLPSHDAGDLVLRWHHAMLALMGAEELQKFGLTLCKPDHGAHL